MAKIIGSLQLDAGGAVGEFSTDGTLVGNSDSAVPTEKAVKTYVDGKVTTPEWTLLETLEPTSGGSVVSTATLTSYNELKFDFVLIQSSSTAFYMTIDGVTGGGWIARMRKDTSMTLYTGYSKAWIVIDSAGAIEHPVMGSYTMYSNASSFSMFGGVEGRSLASGSDVLLVSALNYNVTSKATALTFVADNGTFSAGTKIRIYGR